MDPDLESDDEVWHLPEEAWTLLVRASEHAVDEFREDVERLRAEGMDFRDASMYQHLPPLFLARYDLAFARRFLEAAEAVAARLRWAREEGWPYPSEALLNSVAEELSMEAFLRQAEVLVDLGVDEGDAEDPAAVLSGALEALRELSFKDRDFEWLFSPATDGLVETPEVEAQLGFINLRFADWFEPFFEDWEPVRPEDE